MRHCIPYILALWIYSVRPALIKGLYQYPTPSNLPAVQAVKLPSQVAGAKLVDLFTESAGTEEAGVRNVLTSMLYKRLCHLSNYWQWGVCRFFLNSAAFLYTSLGRSCRWIENMRITQGRWEQSSCQPSFLIWYVLLPALTKTLLAYTDTLLWTESDPNFKPLSTYLHKRRKCILKTCKDFLGT